MVGAPVRTCRTPGCPTTIVVRQEDTRAFLLCASLPGHGIMDVVAIWKDVITFGDLDQNFPTPDVLYEVGAAGSEQLMLSEAVERGFRAIPCSSLFRSPRHPHHSQKHSEGRGEGNTATGLPASSRSRKHSARERTPPEHTKVETVGATAPWPHLGPLALSSRFRAGAKLGGPIRVSSADLPALH